ncbi:Guanine nucleotide-binding protein subunit beta-1 [Thalictrum thalictroides]|uniref:Guanine nucleotide-binding protein subunit beta-1 n=1 Tax=Thalictrum thalictroides TaxID=46969 RepID=A0A7J6W2A9_THATH|nr:Guanine nucleotide-binding protein subunit beta-1 [Thalictrum thalictroides]
MERRDRLRMIMVKLDTEGQLERLLKAHEDEAAAFGAAEEGDGGPHTYPFYTEGSNALLEARIDIAKYSIVRAALRLGCARWRRDDPDEDLDAEINWALKQAGDLTLDCSEIGDDRPLTDCSFSYDGTKLATCAMSGVIKLWSMPQVTKVATLKGHTERATDVVFSPVDNHIATASADHTAILWRLWDIYTGVELLLQEGHSRSVYGLCFDQDGSLAASCGFDALARAWDLRTGRSILALEGHVKPVFGVSFSPNGYHLATGGEDNTCRIWDLRKRKCIHIILAHSNLISQVKFEPQEGYFLANASYDMTAKVWSARDFKHIKTLSGHESKVTALDIIGDGQCIATVAHDRTIKLWSCQSNEKGKAMDIDQL